MYYCAKFHAFIIKGTIVAQICSINAIMKTLNSQTREPVQPLPACKVREKVIFAISPRNSGAQST